MFVFVQVSIPTHAERHLEVAGERNYVDMCVLENLHTYKDIRTSL
jgi:hypothetical protein